MLSQERIPIGKLKHAYTLNDQEVINLIGTLLLSDGVFPTSLWQEAYSYFWLGKLRDTTAQYEFDTPSSPPKPACLSFPEVDIPLDLHNIERYRGKISDLFIELSGFLSSNAMRAGLHYILDETYEPNNIIYKQEMENFFEKLTIEDNNFSTQFISCANAEHFLEIVDKKLIIISSAHYSFISKIFYDAIVVDKVASVRHLDACGCPLRQEVKGISRTFVERIAAEGSMPQVQDDAPDTPSLSKILVPHSLWQGKSPKFVCDNMRQQGFKDPVIIHVLHHWCGITNKTQIGRLLGPNDQNDSTYLRLADRLLAEAATLDIQRA